MTVDHRPDTGLATVVAVSGGSGAGKTTLAFKLLALLGDRATHTTIDWYYHDWSHLSPDERAKVNFDHPDSLEVSLFVEHLAELRQQRAINAPVYDFATHTRTALTQRIEPAPVVVTEGIHLLGLPAVRALCDIAVFVDVPASTRLDRRIQRDAVERGRSEQSVRDQWKLTVAPMHELLVQPSMAHADLVVADHQDLDDVAEHLAAQLA